MLAHREDRFARDEGARLSQLFSFGAAEVNDMAIEQFTDIGRPFNDERFAFDPRFLKHGFYIAAKGITPEYADADGMARLSFGGPVDKLCEIAQDCSLHLVLGMLSLS